MPREGDDTAPSREDIASVVRGPNTPAVLNERTHEPIGLDDLFGSLDEAQDWVKALFFGREGCTKTTALARAQHLPGDGVVVFINAESGLKKAALRQFVDVDKIMFWPKKDPDTGIVPRITRKMLEDLLFQLKALTARDPGAVKVIGMDSVTEVINCAMEEITEEAYLASLGNPKLAKRDNKNDAQLKDWGQLTSDVRMLIRGFRDLPCHFVATALEKELDLGGDFKELAPEMTPKLATSVLGYMDIVVHFVAETIETAEGPKKIVLGQTSPTVKVRAKDRFNVLPFQMADPSFDRIVHYVEGRLDAEEDPTPDQYELIRAEGEKFKDAKKAARLA